MRSTPVNFDFPIKGKNTAWAKSSQPNGTTLDARNVLPFDAIADRARGGQRGGTSKVLAGQQLGGGQLIQALLQATVAGDNSYVEDSAVVGAQLVEETFAYAVNTGLGVSGGNWDCRIDATKYADCLRPSQGASDDLSADYAKTVEGGNGAGRCLRFTPTPSIKAFAGFSNPGQTFPPDHRFEVAVNFDNAPADAMIYFSVRTPVPITDASLYPTIRVSNGGSRLDVFTGLSFDGEFGFLQYEEDLAVPLNGWVTLAIDTISRFGNVDEFDRLHRFYINGVLKTERVYNSNPGPVEPDSADGVRCALGAKFGTASGYVEFDSFKAWTLESLRNEDRIVKLIAVAAGNVYVGTRPGLPLTEVASGALSATVRRVGICESQGKVYLVDGTNTKVLDLADESVNDLTADSGKGTVPANARFCAIWRDRLILVVGQNLYMSRSGVHTDWLYGQQDALSAVALNASESAGRIGQLVFSIIPFRDDNLIIGADHATYILSGDPAASDGQITTSSEAIGHYSQTAWCQDPNGNIYFLGTGGLFRMTDAVGEPENLSRDRLHQYFNAVDRQTHVFEMEWDRDAHGLWIFITPKLTGAAVHLFWDGRLDAFFEVQFPDSHGPTAALVYDGDKSQDRKLLIGGRDGYVRKLNPDALNDDGTAISSYCLIGPLQQFGPYAETILSEFEFVTGTGTTNLVVEVLAGNDAQAAQAAAPQSLATFTTGGRQSRLLKRFRAATFFLKLINSTIDTTWVMERAAAMAAVGGPLR